MDKIRRLRFVGSRQSAVGKEKVASRQSPVASRVAFGNAPKSKIQNPKSIIKLVAKQRLPKFSILHSPFSIPRKASF